MSLIPAWGGEERRKDARCANSVPRVSFQDESGACACRRSVRDASHSR